MAGSCRECGKSEFSCSSVLWHRFCLPVFSPEEVRWLNEISHIYIIQVKVQNTTRFFEKLRGIYFAKGNGKRSMLHT